MAAESVARIVAGCVSVFALAGIVACVLFALRKNASVKAFAGLAVFLAALILGSAAAPFVVSFRYLHSLWIAATIVLYTLALLAIFLAATGAVEAFRHRRNGLIVGLITVPLSIALIGGIAYSIHDGVVLLHEPPLNIAPAASEQIKQPGELIAFAPLNFNFEMPGKPWVAVDAKTLWPDGCLALARVGPQMYFSISAEHPEAAVDLTTFALAKVARDNLSSITSSCTVMDVQTSQLGPLSGTRLYTHATISGQSLTYVQWVCVYRGYLYQLTTAGALKDEKLVREEAEKLAKCLKLIDPSPRVKPPIIVAASKFTSARFAYSINLPGQGWRNWPTLDSDLPDAEWGADQGGDLCVVTIPIWLGALDADMDAVTAALLSRLSIPFDRVKNLQRRDDNQTRGYTCQTSRELGGQLWHYHLRTLRNGPFAYLVAAWTNQTWKIKQLDECLNAITPFKPQALDLSVLTPHEKKAQGILLNALGLELDYRRSFDKAAECFSQAFDADPTDPVALENCAMAWSEAGQKPKALFLITKNINKFPDRWSLRAKAAQLEADVGNPEMAIKIFDSLFRNNYKDDIALAQYAALLVKQNKMDDAISLVEHYGYRSASLDVVIMLADLYGRKGEHERALALLRQRQANVPFDAQLSVALAEHYLDAEQFNDALATVNYLRANSGETAMGYQLMGRAQMGLKQYREAQASLETASRMDPADPMTRQWLAHVSGLMGQGNNAAVKIHVDPVPIPPELAAIDETAPKAIGKGYSGCYLHRVTAISFEKGKQLRSSEYRTVQVLDQQGAEQMSTCTYDFDPLSECIFVNKLEVYDADGKLVSSSNADNSYIVDDTSRDYMATNKKVLNVPVSGLRPGYRICSLVTRRDLGTPDHMRFKEHLFAPTFPVAREIVFLSGDVAAVRYQASPGISTKPMAGGFAFVMEKPPVRRYEPLQQPLHKFLPTLALAGNDATWQSEAKEFFETVGDVIKPDPEAAALSRRLTENAGTDAEKLAAILKHVQKDYTYKAIEFGRGARVPRRPGEVIHNHYGDCKDHSLLLQQLLAAAGIPSSLTLVCAEQDVRKELPSLDQFDHMIVYSPIDGGRFFDCTGKDCPIAGGVPSGLAGKEVLVLEDAGPRFLKIPEYSGDSSVILADRQLTIVNDTDVAVKEKLTCRGYYSAMFRVMLKYAEPKDRPQALQSMLARRGVSVTLDDLGVENLDDPEAPLVITMSYTLPRRFNPFQSQLIGIVPSAWERFCLVPDPVEPRETPFEVEFPIVFRSTVTMALPEKWRLAAAPAAQNLQGRFARATISCDLNAGALKLNATLERPAGRYPADAYREFQRSWDGAISGLEPHLVLQASNP